MALNSVSHPRGSWWSRLRARFRPQLRASAIEETTITLSTYAEAGETVTCENGHPICNFMRPVAIGQMQDLARDLGNWRQTAPIVGQAEQPRCAKCGAEFYRSGIFHFADGWRTEGRN